MIDNEEIYYANEEIYYAAANIDPDLIASSTDLEYLVDLILFLCFPII